MAKRLKGLVLVPYNNIRLLCEIYFDKYILKNYSYIALIHTNRGYPQAPAATREVMLTNRRLLWDEENRLTAVSDNGYVSTYLYDASGERTVKLTGDGEGMTVNGRLSGGRTSTDGFTAYVNPYVVISNGSRLSKHIYAGSQRIVSKLCASGSSPSNPLILAKAAEGVVNYTAKYTALKASVAARYDSLGLPFLGADHAGSGFWTPTPTTRETDQYFYHPDHLGSSSLITTLGGVLAQHLEYLPFGEVLVDERATPTTRSTPYKFNAKELDEETGLYYYSARYLDPRLSLWLSVDPLAEKYPGVGSYVYCLNNPVKFVDPDGREVRIMGNDNYRKETFNNLQQLSSNKLILLKTGKVVEASSYKGERSQISLFGTVTGNGKDKVNGTKLVQDVISNKHTVTIQTGEDNEFTPTSRNNASSPKVGSGGKLHFNNEPSGFIRGIINEDGTDYVSDQSVLGHELLHARHSFEGTINYDNVDVLDPDQNYWPVPMNREELRTRRFENYIRSEQHDKPRAQPIINK